MRMFSEAGAESHEARHKPGRAKGWIWISASTNNAWWRGGAGCCRSAILQSGCEVCRSPGGFPHCSFRWCRGSFKSGYAGGKREAGSPGGWKLVMHYIAMETGGKGNDRAKKGPRSKESAINARTATCGWRGVRLLGKPRNWLVPVDLQRLRVASLRHKGEPGRHHPDPASSSLGVVASLQKMCRDERTRTASDCSSNTHKASAKRIQVLQSDNYVFVNSSTAI